MPPLVAGKRRLATCSGAPPVRATDLPILTWVSHTQARNWDKFLKQVVVSNSPE
jgi:hypothetical protein